MDELRSMVFVVDGRFAECSDLVAGDGYGDIATELVRLAVEERAAAENGDGWRGLSKGDAG